MRVLLKIEISDFKFWKLDTYLSFSMTTRGPPESVLQGMPGGVPSVTLPHTHTWWLESKAYVLVIHINENYNNVYTLYMQMFYLAISVYLVHVVIPVNGYMSMCLINHS